SGHETRAGSIADSQKNRREKIRIELQTAESGIAGREPEVQSADQPDQEDDLKRGTDLRSEGGSETLSAAATPGRPLGVFGVFGPGPTAEFLRKVPRERGRIEGNLPLVRTVLRIGTLIDV